MICDVFVEDRKNKRVYKVEDVLLVGDDMNLIESNQYFYNKVCKKLPITPAKLTKLIESKSLRFKKIDFKKRIGQTAGNAGWQTTRT